MGLLDEMGKMLGGGAQGGGGGLDIAALAQQLLTQQGGLQGLVQQLQKGGLGEAVASWVGTGQNLPVNADQIRQALGSSQVNELAGKFGLDAQQLPALLAQHLPGLVDKLTPNGQIPAGNDLLAQGAGLLKGFLNKG
jgi:uncharacterized protein YidB (DUF937 family)